MQLKVWFWFFLKWKRFIVWIVWMEHVQIFDENIFWLVLLLVSWLTKWNLINIRHLKVTAWPRWSYFMSVKSSWNKWMIKTPLKKKKNMLWSEFYILIGSAAVKLLSVLGPLAPSLWPHAGQQSTRMGLAEQFKMVWSIRYFNPGVCGKSRSVAFVATAIGYWYQEFRVHSVPNQEIEGEQREISRD